VSTDALLIVLVACVASLFAYATLTTARGYEFLDRSQSVVLPVVLVFWLLVPAALASQGALDRYDPLPAPALILVGVLTLGTVGLALSPFGARLAAGIPLAGLVGFQAFRVPLEWLLHELYGEGRLPVQMTYAGRNFDIVSGLLAAALAYGLWKGGRAGWLVVAWNLLGMALLVNIVTIAVLSTPVPFRYFLNEPPNLLPSTFPFVWIPTFLVQAALFGHILVFRAGAPQLTRLRVRQPTVATDS